tara:strand:+ start:508 stop:720 length:213 start_codon:yes stop_codon:yes gene_type:complete
MSNEKYTSNGIGLGTLLFLVFLTLKLAEVGPVQYWSWWWVTAPLWLPLLVVIVLVFVVGLTVAIAHLNRK